MKNRIEELIKICTERVPYYPAGNNGHPECSIEFNKQKFAELAQEAVDYMKLQADQALVAEELTLRERLHLLEEVKERINNV